MRRPSRRRSLRHRRLQFSRRLLECACCMNSYVQPVGHPRPHRIWLHTVCDLVYCGIVHPLGAPAEGPPATPHTQNSQEEEFDVLPWLKPGGSNPTTDYLCGRRAELRFTVRRPASAEVSP